MICYSAAIGAYGRRAGSGKCSGIAVGDASEQLEPRVTSYSAAVSACKKGQQWKKSLGLLQEILERWHMPCDQLQRGHQHMQAAAAALGTAV